MKVNATPIEGLYELLPEVWQDERGWFTEIFQLPKYKKLGVNDNFIQDNLSFSKKGVLRGLHLQLPPFEQAKIVRVMTGSVLDVVVDLRRSSKTFGMTYTCQLEAKKQNILIVPEGFAHGFAALEDTLFFYKCSNTYSKDHETGIIWNDRDLNIDWKITDPLLSDKDKLLPTFKDLIKNF